MAPAVGQHVDAVAADQLGGRGVVETAERMDVDELRPAACLAGGVGRIEGDRDRGRIVVLQQRGDELLQLVLGEPGGDVADAQGPAGAVRIAVRERRAHLRVAAGPGPRGGGVPRLAVVGQQVRIDLELVDGRRGRGLAGGRERLARLFEPALVQQGEAVAQQAGPVEPSARQRHAPHHRRHGDELAGIERVGRRAGVGGVGLAAPDVDADAARRQHGPHRARILERDGRARMALGEPGAREPVARLLVERRGGHHGFEHLRGALGVAGQQLGSAGLDAGRIRNVRHAVAP